MKKHLQKTSCQISSALIAVVMVGGILVFLTAPGQNINDDQQQLQQELLKNSELLNEQGTQQWQADQVENTAQDPIVSTPPALSDSNAAQPISGELSVRFTAIGDSVMLGAVPALKEIFPDSVISAAESRQVWEVEAIVSELEEQGNLMDTVVIALGANGSFSKKSGQALLDLLGPERQIYWIAPYGQNLYWEDSTFEILQDLEEKNENLTVLNWPEAAKQRSDWFYDDGMHLNDAGKTGYAQFLMDSLSFRAV